MRHRDTGDAEAVEAVVALVKDAAATQDLV